MLGQGKKVLVTAQTNRALEVLVRQIPASFHQLVVFLLEGKSRDDSVLKKSIQALQQSLNESDPAILEQELVHYRQQRLQLEQQKR